MSGLNDWNLVVTPPPFSATITIADCLYLLLLREPQGISLSLSLLNNKILNTLSGRHPAGYFLFSLSFFFFWYFLNSRLLFWILSPLLCLRFNCRLLCGGLTGVGVAGKSALVPFRTNAGDASAPWCVCVWVTLVPSSLLRCQRRQGQNFYVFCSEMER